MLVEIGKAAPMPRDLRSERFEMPRIFAIWCRYRSAVTGKWMRARYVAELHEIAARHAPGEWEIIGSPEIRDVDPNAAHFNPWRPPPVLPRFRYPLYEAH